MSAHGGPRLGSGHECADFTRHKIVRIGVTESEFDILTQLGEQWGVPRGTAAYGLLLDRINECRNGLTDATTGVDTIVRAASRIVMKAAKARERTKGETNGG